MAVKTITIDIEAYEMLSQEKRERESFSDVVKRTFGPKRRMKELLKAIRQNPVSEETILQVDRTTRKIRKAKERKIG